MKVKFERTNLLNSFSQAASVVPSRAAKEILQFVKMDAQSSGIVTLLGTDMDVGVRIELPEAEILEAGSALIPVGRFGALLRESTDESVFVEGTPQGITVRGDRFELQLTAADPSEFPDVPAFEEERYHEVSAKLARELIRRTIFATDQETTRYAFSGILLEMGESGIVAVGTDGRRLAKMEGPARAVNGHATESGSTVVPARAMQVVERSLTDTDGDVLIAARDNSVLLRAGRLSLFARLVSGRFPDWRQVLPNSDMPVQISFPVGPMLAAVRQASIVATKERRGVDFRFREGSLVLAAAAAETGRSHVELPIGYDGPELILSLDHRFVLEFLRVLDIEKSFTIRAQDEEHAVVFATDDGYEYVVMPMARSVNDGA